MRPDDSNSERRRYQFSLGALFALTTWIAIYLAIRRIDLPDLIPPWLAPALLPVAVTFAISLLVILGTGLVLVYFADRGLTSRLGRGAAIGAGLAALTVGWVAVNISSDVTGIHPYLSLVAVVAVGGLLGSLGGLIAPRLARALDKLASRGSRRRVVL